jgi:hypothetical protein
MPAELENQSRLKMITNTTSSAIISHRHTSLAQSRFAFSFFSFFFFSAANGAGSAMI